MQIVQMSINLHVEALIRIGDRAKGYGNVHIYSDRLNRHFQGKAWGNGEDLLEFFRIFCPKNWFFFTKLLGVLAPSRLSPAFWRIRLWNRTCYLSTCQMWFVGWLSYPTCLNFLVIFLFQMSSLYHFIHQLNHLRGENQIGDLEMFLRV